MPTTSTSPTLAPSRKHDIPQSGDFHEAGNFQRAEISNMSHGKILVGILIWRFTAACGVVTSHYEKVTNSSNGYVQLRKRGINDHTITDGLSQHSAHNFPVPP